MTDTEKELLAAMEDAIADADAALSRVEGLRDQLRAAEAELAKAVLLETETRFKHRAYFMARGIA